MEKIKELNKLNLYQDKIKQLQILNSRLVDDDKLSLQEWMQLLTSDKCNVIHNDKGVCVYATHNNIFYMYYIISYKDNIGFLQDILRKFENDYKITFSVNIQNIKMLRKCNKLGFVPNLTYNNIKDEGISSYYLITHKNINLSLEDKTTIKYLKDEFAEIHSTSNLRVVFDLDDTLTKIDELVYQKLGLFEKYENPTWFTVSEEDRQHLMSIYKNPNTYDCHIEINTDYLDLLIQVLGKDNVILYSHCLSPEIASFKYNWIKSKLNKDISIVFSFDGSKPPIDCLTLVDDSFSNIKDSNINFAFHIKKFYNKGKFEINQAVESIFENILFRRF